MGEEVSRSTVSRVTKSLEEKVEGLRTQSLTQAFPYVYLLASAHRMAERRFPEVHTAKHYLSRTIDGSLPRTPFSWLPEERGGSIPGWGSTAMHQRELRPSRRQAPEPHRSNDRPRMDDGRAGWSPRATNPSHHRFRPHPEGS
ncbi:transposase mutator type [Myxococcus stipitatus DSM 14675]|uniref:Transposase mutator type n=1 Tax=Myxococcus stipitatus (strain DSM 14675 / JCM 12634 / Mx s8) TaxID=1278073 RepID=L7UK35_MYXSD|nr:transposase mutator type [Myxococcus stipitatus DSM 14675]